MSQQNFNNITTHDDLTTRLTANATEVNSHLNAKDQSNGYAGLTLFKINLRNVLGTIVSYFTTAATVARTWTLPDKSGTVALLDDIPAPVIITGKQDTLVNTTNIRSVGGTSLLGSGDIPFPVEDLTTKFDQEQVYEYTDNSINKIRISNESDALKFLKAYGIAIKGESLFADLNECLGSTLSSASTRLTWYKVNKSITITELGYYLRTAGVFTPGTANNLSLYSVNMTTKIATLVADTGNVTTLWSGALGARRVPLVTPYVAAEGYYLLGMRYEASGTATTTPTILGQALDGSAVAVFETAKLAVSTTANLPATIDLNVATGQGICYWLMTN